MTTGMKKLLNCFKCRINKILQIFMLYFCSLLQKN